jgi:hypothetical protein
MPIIDAPFGSTTKLQHIREDHIGPAYPTTPAKLQHFPNSASLY